MSERVAALGALSRPGLMDLWVKRYGVAPPLGVRQPLLLRAAAQHIQEKQLGGLSTNGKRLLKIALTRVCRNVDTAGDDAATAFPDASGVPTDSLAEPATDAKERPASFRPVPLPGARLIREWNGRRYVVEVVDGGFVMDGKPYRSLTAIAFRITGVRWSGPRFFGL